MVTSWDCKGTKKSRGTHRDLRAERRRVRGTTFRLENRLGRASDLDLEPSRAAIARIRRNLLAVTGREPTIANVQRRLAPLGLNASVRTVRIDLDYCRAT